MFDNQKEALKNLTRNSFQLQNCVHALFSKLARPPATAATFILIEKALYLHVVVEHGLRTHDDVYIPNFLRPKL